MSIDSHTPRKLIYKVTKSQSRKVINLFLVAFRILAKKCESQTRIQPKEKNIWTQAFTKKLANTCEKKELEKKRTRKFPRGSGHIIAAICRLLNCFYSHIAMELATLAFKQTHYVVGQIRNSAEYGYEYEYGYGYDHGHGT